MEVFSLFSLASLFGSSEKESIQRVDAVLIFPKKEGEQIITQVCAMMGAKGIPDLCPAYDDDNIITEVRGDIMAVWIRLANSEGERKDYLKENIFYTLLNAYHQKSLNATKEAKE